MEKVEFKKLLFNVAFCTMACDGHIDKKEIEEMKVMDKTTSFFNDVDLSEELIFLIQRLESVGAKVIEELFKVLRSEKLNPVQELLVLEVALRIANADGRHDDNEIKFLKHLRAKLEIHDKTIIDRFGDIDVLNTSSYTNNVLTAKQDASFAKSVTLPELPDLKDFVLKNWDAT
ncbi:MAG: tellurite resistance TerB family protein [Cycloclasticus sp.]|nr:tellurite resistance TerB family protein [Cycloclasticus sp.]